MESSFKTLGIRSGKSSAISPVPLNKAALECIHTAAEEDSNNGIP